MGSVAEASCMQGPSQIASHLCAPARKMHRGALQKAASSHQINAPASMLASSYMREPRGPLKCCRKAWGSRRCTQGCTWSMHGSWRGAEGVIKGQRSVFLKSSPSPAGLASQEGLVSGITCLHCQDVSCGTHSGAALNRSAFFQRAPGRLPNVIFNISYIQGPDIHLPACATSIWPKAYNTLVSQERVNLAQKPPKQPVKVLIALPFPTAQVQTSGASMWLTAHPGLFFPFKKLHPFCVSTCSFCFVDFFFT